MISDLNICRFIAEISKDRFQRRWMKMKRFLGQMTTSRKILAITPKVRIIDRLYSVLCSFSLLPLFLLFCFGVLRNWCGA